MSKTKAGGAELLVASEEAAAESLLLLNALAAELLNALAVQAAAAAVAASPPLPQAPGSSAWRHSWRTACERKWVGRIAGLSTRGRGFAKFAQRAFAAHSLAGGPWLLRRRGCCPGSRSDAGSTGRRPREASTGHLSAAALLRIWKQSSGAACAAPVHCHHYLEHCRARAAPAPFNRRRNHSLLNQRRPPHRALGAIPGS